MIHKKGSGTKVLITLLVIMVCFLVFVLAGGPKITANVVKNLGCDEVTKYKTEYVTESYQTSSKGCDRITDCRCLHKSWGGLGACDSCSCTKEVRKQVPYTVEECVWE